MLDFTKTTVDMTRFDEGINEILPHFGLSSIAASDLDISLSEDLAAFHLDYDLHTRKTIILASKSVIRRDRIMKLYDQSEKLDLRSDPFAFLVCALSTVIYDWGTFSGTHFKKLDSIVCILSSLIISIPANYCQYLGTMDSEPKGGYNRRGGTAG